MIKIQQLKTPSFSSAGLGTSVGLVVMLTLSTSLLPNNIEAAIFKCVDANGDTSYKQTPCATESETAKVLSTASSSKASVDCRIANNFARKTAISMRSGSSSGDVFDSYGGIDALPRTSVGVINYVYSHKDNVDTGPQRIAALSAARCSAGSYGPVDCDDFPYNFISELGGCESATMATLPAQTVPMQSTAQEAVPNTAGTQALGVRTVADETAVKENCKKDLASQMNDLFANMRSGQSATEQSALEDRKKALSSQLSGC